MNTWIQSESVLARTQKRFRWSSAGCDYSFVATLKHRSGAQRLEAERVKWQLSKSRIFFLQIRQTWLTRFTSLRRWTTKAEPSISKHSGGKSSLWSMLRQSEHLHHILIIFGSRQQFFKELELIVLMQMRVNGQLVQAAGGAAGTSCVQGPCHPCLPLQSGVLSSSNTSLS